MGFLQLSKQPLAGRDPGTDPTTKRNAPNSFRVQAKLQKEEGKRLETRPILSYKRPWACHERFYSNVCRGNVI